jgi:hypothetical protein
MESNTNTIIDDHRNMLMVSKKISDFQEQNLKQWPMIVFDGISNVKVDYNFINKEELFYAGKVIFDFEFTNGQLPTEEKRQQAFRDLDVWTKFLFWVDTEVEFKLKGRVWK